MNAGPPIAVRPIDQIDTLVEQLLAGGEGPVAIADALVTVAARLMKDKVGNAGAALWLRDVMEDVRLGRNPSR